MVRRTRGCRTAWRSELFWLERSGLGGVEVAIVAVADAVGEELMVAARKRGLKW
jgi:hypothetical protein